MNPKSANQLPALPSNSNYDPTDKSLPALPDKFLTPDQQKQKKAAAAEREQEMKRRSEQEKQLKAERERLAKQEQEARERERRLRRDEQDLDRKKSSSGGWLRYIFNCRCLGCGMLILIIGSIAGIAFLLLARPPLVWEPVKDWLNAGLEANPHDGTTLDSAKTELKLQLKEFKVGENDLVITESQLKPLINERLKNINAGEIHADIQSGRLKLYWDVVPAELTPLWMIIELVPNAQGQPAIDYAGTQRIPAPGFLNLALTRLALTALNISGVSSGTDLITVLLPLPENVTVTKVEFDQDKMTVTLNVSTGLDSILDF